MTFGDMTKEVNVFNLGRQPRDINDQTFEINSVENLTNKHEESIEMETDSMEMVTESEFDLESKDFNLDQIIDLAVDWTSSPSVPHHRTEIPDITSNESIPSLELKALPEHLKYAYLGGRETLQVIIASHRLSNKRTA